MLPRHADRRASFGGRDVAIAAFLVLALLFGVISVAHPQPMPPPSRPPSSDFVALQPGASPEAVVMFDAADQRLTVTSHARRDLLVCLHGDCRLVEEWLGK